MKGRGSKKTPSFEEGLLRLEMIAKEMEQGELTLEESLTIFAEGMELSKICLTKLDMAQQQVEQLLQGKNEQFSTLPLNMEDATSC